MKEWGIPDLCNALRATTEVAYHPQDGKGVLFSVGLSHTKVSWWTQTHHLHVLTPSMVFDAYRMHVCAVEEDDAYVSWTGGKAHAYRHIWIQADGGVHFYLPGSPDKAYDFPKAHLRSHEDFFNGK